MAQTAPLNIRIDEDVKKDLGTISRATERPMAYHAGKAIERYVVQEKYIIDRINKGINDTDQGDFASDEEMEGILNKY